MGNMEIPSQSAHVVKIPNATYEFGANVLDQKVKGIDGFPFTDFSIWETKKNYIITNALSVV